MALTAAGLASLRTALVEHERRDGADSERERAPRRAAGAYFTPQPLVDFVVRETVGAAFASRKRAWRADGSPELRVLDPAAGDGRFLVAALAALTDRAASEGFEPEASRQAIARRCLVGVERDADFAEAARAAVPGATIHCAEALLDAPIEGRGFDVVVGNPPYLRSLRFDGPDRALREALRGRFAASVSGEWDLFAVFLERALEWASDGGEVGMVVPSRWWTAKSAAALRELVGAGGQVRALVDFGAEQLFAGATTYVSLAFLSRTRQPAATVARARDGAFELGRVDAASLGAAPWRLSVGRRGELLESLAARGPALGDVARIAKGAGTNADRVFVFLGEAPVEDELLRPVLRGRDVASFGRVDAGLRLLVPYDEGGRLIAPGELHARFPRATAYLESQRAVLEARERGRFRGDRFYCFGRPQNLRFLFSPAPKVVVPDVAREGRALLDGSGAMVLDSAYALRSSGGVEVSLEALLAVLASRVVGLWLREHGAQLRGGYVRMKTAYLRSLPLPPPSPALTEAARLAVGAAVDADEIDDLVRRAYGVSRSDWC